MSVQIINADVREGLAQLEDESVQMVLTSPPYWGLRCYGTDGQLGLEPTLSEHIETLLDVFREVRRVLRKDGTFWLNYGDAYNAYNGGAGPTSKLSRTQSEQRPRLQSGYSLRNKALKPKDLLLIPHRLAIALQEDGWWVRSDIIWAKPNPMPESIKDRPTTAHEHVFLLSKQQRYFWDAEEVKENAVSDHKSGNGFARPEQISRDGRGQAQQWDDVVGRRSLRNVWTIATKPFPDAHFATFPPELAERCIKAGCPKGGTVLDPFGGAGTTGLVADRLERNTILIEINPEYCEMARQRIEGDAPMFTQVEDRPPEPKQEKML